MYPYLFVDIEGTELTNSDILVLSHPAVCGVILFSRNFTDIRQLQNLSKEIKRIKTPGLLIAVDQEGGSVQRFRDPFTELPSLNDIGRLYNSDPDLARAVTCEHAGIMVRELRAVGVDLSFTPVVDVGNDKSKVLNTRTFSNNSEIVSQLALIYLRAMKKNGMNSVAKHFPGHGGVREDSHIELPIDNRDLSMIWECDLAPFRILIKNNLSAIMMAHILFKKVDNQAAGYSKEWISRILRKRMGFSGFVFSDDLSMKGAQKKGGIISRVSAAMQAGCDILLICNDRASVEEILDSLKAPIQMDILRKILDNLKAAPYKSALSFMEIRNEHQRILDRFDLKLRNG